MVLSPLSETTTPSRIRFGISVLSSGLPLLTLQRLDAGDGLAHLVDPMGLLGLAGGGLEAQVELFLLQLQELFLQLIGGHGAQVGDLHHGSDPFPQCSAATPASSRVTTLVRTGSLAAPRRRAS